MVCIYCSQPTAVTNSREQKRSHGVWRRRRCTACGATFTTIESPELSTSIVVKSGDSALRPFSRDKLLLSVADSCRHRKNKASVTEATTLTDTIIRILLKTGKAELEKRFIADTTHSILKRFDRLAAAHYEAYYLL